MKALCFPRLPLLKAPLPKASCLTLSESDPVSYAAQQNTKPATWEKTLLANDLTVFSSPQKKNFANLMQSTYKLGVL